MKLGKLTAKNFQSYSDLEFDYADLGLTLVSGETKSGKSTLLDAAAWVLYGTTSKDSAADDVKSWFADGAATEVQLLVTDGNGKEIRITRKRGKASQNDLYYEEDNSGVLVRGKDLLDTQRLLESRIGVSAELYLNGSYIHQFSRADAIFTAKSKERRETFERIADLSLAIKLGAAASERRKIVKAGFEKQLMALTKCRAQRDQLLEDVTGLGTMVQDWEVKKSLEIKQLQTKADAFESDKTDRIGDLVSKMEELDKMIQPVEDYDTRIQQMRTQYAQATEQLGVLQAAESEFTLLKLRKQMAEKDLTKFLNQPAVCPECLGPTTNANKAKHLKELEQTIAQCADTMQSREAKLKSLRTIAALAPKLQEQMMSITEEKNENQALLVEFDRLKDKALTIKNEKNQWVEKIITLKTAQNPYVKQLKDKESLAESKSLEADTLDREAIDTEDLVVCLDWLYDASFQLRGALLQQAINQINVNTNNYLEKFFDAAIRVRFALKDSDKLDITITNEGYECPYKQLSGGERCMLKLAFSLSYIKLAENTAGVKFSTLMLDESFAGLDANLKMKAFTLLDAVSQDYDSVLVIDHSEELKLLFPKEFHVSKDSVHSQLREIERD